jgi:hypothetical protein
MNTLKQIGMGLALISTLAMTGCSSDGSDDSGGGGGTTEEGTFVDAPVMGLRYKTDTQANYTDKKGTFWYDSGQKIEFFLGDLSLGKVDAGAVISPYTMAGVKAGDDTSDHATNIALLLQNLDLHRDDNDVLDLSKFKNHKFGTIDLVHKSSAEMESKISELMNDNTFAGLLDKDGHNLMTSATVKEHMKAHVKVAMDRLKDKLSDLYGKTYVRVECSELIGCSVDGQQISAMNDKVFTHTQDGKTKTYPYNIIKGIATIKVKTTKSSTGEYYTIFSNTSKNVVKTCEGITLEDAKDCSEKSIYVLANVKDEYIQAKGKNNLEKTLVTDFADIKIPLYTLIGDTNDIDLYSFYIEIDSDGKFNKVDGFDKEDLNAVFDGNTGILHVTGIDRYGNAYDKKGKVYKYDLSGKTIKKDEFTNKAIFGDNSIASHLPKKFTFAQGSSMYCPILDNKCFVDKATINQMLKQAGKDEIE